MRKLLFLYCLILISLSVSAQSTFKCYPTNWFTGMAWNKLQIMVHGDKVANHFPMIKISADGIKLATGVRLIKIERVENPNYIFLDLVIDPSAKPGTFSFPFLKDIKLDYELKAKRLEKGKAYAQGVTAKDLIYLIIPDRFSNGDTTNDKVPGMRDQSLDRTDVAARHGGDLQGITNHLDYLKNLGITTIWLTPVLENDMPSRTEHGYAITDHYTIDPRLGGAKAYHKLIDAAHAKGLKIIQDAVYNHVGLYHFTVQDQPTKDWLHQWPKYTQTNFKDQEMFDPYGSKIDKKILTDGWFNESMPDMNESNPFVANFLIENALWSVQEFGIDGWRIDTYAYNDLPFMNRCNKAIIDDNPQISIFGETWYHGVVNQSYAVQNNLDIPFKSNLPGSTDFQTLWAITDALTKDYGWDEGVNKLYTTLAQDIVYKDPTREVIFLDNHDMSRFFSTVNENIDKYQTALAWLLTCRGVPQIYYSDELATAGTTSPSDGYVRLDFPGGFAGDKIDKFSQQGRTEKDNLIYNYFSTLANFRKQSNALTTGKLMQYVPNDGVYVYFRYSKTQTIMIVLNTAKTEKKIQINNFAERTDGFTKFTDILTKETGTLKDFTVGSYKAAVYELKN